MRDPRRRRRARPEDARMEVEPADGREDGARGRPFEINHTAAAALIYDGAEIRRRGRDPSLEDPRRGRLSLEQPVARLDPD